MSYKVAREVVQQCIDTGGSFVKCNEQCLANHRVYSDCLGMTLSAWWHQFNTDQKFLFIVGIPLAIIMCVGIFFLLAYCSYSWEEARENNLQSRPPPLPLKDWGIKDWILSISICIGALAIIFILAWLFP
jgi:hypothetical protein